MKKIKLPKSSIWVDEEGFIWVKFHTHDMMELADMKRQIKEIVKLCDGNPRLFIIDGRGAYANISKESREYAANHPDMAYLRKAQAILVDKLPNRLTANAFIKFNKPPNPVKVFDNAEDAKKWLKQFK